MCCTAETAPLTGWAGTCEASPHTDTAPPRTGDKSVVVADCQTIRVSDRLLVPRRVASPGRDPRSRSIGNDPPGKYLLLHAFSTILSAVRSVRDARLVLVSGRSRYPVPVQTQSQVQSGIEAFQRYPTLPQGPGVCLGQQKFPLLPIQSAFQCLFHPDYLLFFFASSDSRQNRWCRVFVNHSCMPPYLGQTYHRYREKLGVQLTIIRKLSVYLVPRFESFLSF